MKKENHSYANIFPMLAGVELEELIVDIGQNGLNNPIILHEDQILDGRNRYLACQRSGVTPRFETYQGSDPLSFVVSENLHRRHLTPSQRAAVAVDMQSVVDTLKAEAKERQIRKPVEEIGQPEPKDSVPAKLPEQIHKEDNETRTKLSNMTGASPRYISDAQKIKEKSPEIHEKVKSGAVKIPDAKILIRETPEVQKDILERVEAGKVKNVKEAKREIRKEEYQERVQEVEQKRVEEPMITELPNLILADPPWKYDFAETSNRQIENQYDTATVSDMKDHLPETQSDCILLMWATAPKLREAFELIDLWGFEYKTHAVWDKEKIGMGYWFRGRHELLFVATKGKVSPPLSNFRVPSVFREARTQHSKKPKCVYEWIEQAFGDRVKLEMYCRESRPGWSVFGNEI